MSSSTRGPVRVRLVSDITAARLPSTRIKSVLSSIIKRERGEGTVDVVIVEDIIMRRLNRRFKGKDKTTDVLSFPFAEPLPGAESERLIGELYCNYAHCRRWIAENGGTIGDELLRLAVHGCLHLFGHDHHRPEDNLRMKRAENRYLATGGLIRSREARAQ